MTKHTKHALGPTKVASRLLSILATLACAAFFAFVMFK